MDFYSTDREPTITDIKTLIADLNEKITNYKTAYNPKKMESNAVMVKGNNGTVSCNKYCHGIGGKSWNNELPIAWKGAQCVGAGKNRNIPCSKAIKERSGNLECLCKRNDSFPYETRDRAWRFPDVTVPDTEDTYISDTHIDYSKLTNMGDSIHSQINEIDTLIKTVLPKMYDNEGHKDKIILPLLKQIEELKVTYKKLEKEAKKPNYFENKVEAEKIKATSSFNNYVLYLIYFILFFIALFFILKNPEAGNLDMFILMLGISIFIYYAYEYYVMKQRTK
jgi:hypothetical protein